MGRWTLNVCRPIQPSAHVMLELFLLLVTGVLLARLVGAPGAGDSGERPMHKAYYRTRDGRADYRFGFVQRNDGTWRIYILSQPDYGGQNASQYDTHRLSDGSPYYYVCWTGRLRSLEQAKRVAATWADRTQRYIQTGSF